MTKVYMPDTSYKRLVVDYQALGDLADLFDEEGKKIPEILISTHADMEKLAEDWKGPNYEAYMTFFEDLYEDVMQFHDFVRYFGELMHDVTGEFRQLEVDIDGAVAGALDGCH